MKKTERINAYDFDYDIIKTIPDLPRRKGDKLNGKEYFLYKDAVCAFDIETSNIPFLDCAVMYCWAFQLDEIATIVGRTWEEFQYMIREIAFRLWSDQRLYVAVHNLAFEFQFLSGIYSFSNKEVFAVKPRRVLRASMINNKIQFACSYLHSNMTLAEYTRKMKVEHVKLSGEEFNYNRIRFPWTPLTEYEWDYQQHDVMGLVESIKSDMKFEGDNLYSFPMTSTGYVRRDVRNAMYKAKVNVKHLVPDFDTYEMAREAFRGGDTHANRFHAGVHLTNVKSADRKSSYPDVICNCLYPMKPMQLLEDATMDDLIKLITVRHRACLIRIAFEGIRLRNRYYGCPYLSKDKCRNIIDLSHDDGSETTCVYDNGRVLQAGYLETTITDVDMLIISDIYEWKKVKVLRLKYAEYDKLPSPIIEQTINYFRMKTKLQDVPGEEIYYVKAKNKNNSIYGMMAQDPCKISIDYDNGEWNDSKEKTKEELLSKHKRSAFLSYTWAPWVTAWARLRLHEGIELAGFDNHVYNDTDSVKYLYDIDWSAYNKERIADSLKSGAYADDSKGVRYYMGVYEMEHEMSDFATLGAKKYCFINKGENDLRVTIAGVTKKTGGKELQEHGGIERFCNPPFTFHESGGLEAVYHDEIEPRIYEIDGHKLVVTKNVQLIPSTYTLGLAGEYERLLSGDRVI